MFDASSDESTGYHLFFEPQGSLAHELDALIKDLAAQYNGPVFSPHVTLLSRISYENESSVVEKADMLAASLAPLNLTLGDLQSQQQYFRALYACVLHPEDVNKYHEKAAKAFSMEINVHYVPHLSLLYGNYPESIKTQLKNTVQLPQNASFIADTLHLYKTHGRVENWYKVQEFSLRG